MVLEPAEWGEARGERLPVVVVVVVKSRKLGGSYTVSSMWLSPLRRRKERSLILILDLKAC